MRFQGIHNLQRLHLSLHGIF